MTIRLLWEEHIQASPIAVELAVRGWCDIKGRGHGEDRMIIGSGQQAIIGFAMNGREELPVGVIAFEHEAATKRIWVQMSYVHEEFRGQGVFTAMWNGLVAHAQELAVRKIEGSTHVRNLAMRAVAKKLGRAEEWVVTVYNVEL